MKLILKLLLVLFTFKGSSQNSISEINIDVFSNYSIIGLGEESHGIKTINEFRNQITYELVNRYKIKYIIWEESFADLYKVNKLLELPNPNFDEILTHFTWFWQTEETKSLLNFIHQYNQKNEDDKILLLGMDLSPHISIYNNVIDFFTEKITNTNILEEYSKYKNKFKSYKRLKKKENKKLIKIGNTLLTELKLNELKYLDWYSKNEVELMKINIRNLISSSSYFRKNSESRDLTMFKTVDSIYSLCQQDEKVVVFAHNGHLQKKDDYEFQKIVGTYLDEKYGEKYFALGFEFGQGEYLCSESSIGIIRTLFRAYVLKKSIRKFMSSKTQLIALNSNSDILSYLYDIDQEYSFFSYHNLDKDNEIYKLLNSNQLYHNIGGGCIESDRAYIKRKWNERFDGIFFIKNVKATNAKF